MIIHTFNSPIGSIATISFTSISVQSMCHCTHRSSSVSHMFCLSPFSVAILSSIVIMLAYLKMLVFICERLLSIYQTHLQFLNLFSLAVANGYARVTQGFDIGWEMRKVANCWSSVKLMRWWWMLSSRDRRIGLLPVGQVKISQRWIMCWWGGRIGSEWYQAFYTTCS